MSNNYAITETELNCLATVSRNDRPNALWLLGKLRMEYNYTGIGEVVRRHMNELNLRIKFMPHVS